MDKIIDKSCQLLDYIFDTIKKNSTTFNNSYYITKFTNQDGFEGRIMVSLNDPISLIKLEEGDEGIYFTFNIESQTCLLFNRFEINCPEKAAKILDLTANKDHD
jgi:hypothetical protein